MRKEDTYTLLGTLFSDTLAWVSGKRKSPKVLNLRTFLIFFRLYQAVRTGLEPEDVHNLIFKLLRRPYVFSVTNM